MTLLKRPVRVDAYFSVTHDASAENAGRNSGRSFLFRLTEYYLRYYLFYR